MKQSIEEIYKTILTPGYWAIVSILNAIGLVFNVRKHDMLNIGIYGLLLMWSVIVYYAIKRVKK